MSRNPRQSQVELTGGKLDEVDKNEIRLPCVAQRTTQELPHAQDSGGSAEKDEDRSPELRSTPNHDITTQTAVRVAEGGI